MGARKVLCSFGTLVQRKKFTSSRGGIHLYPVVFHHQHLMLLQSAVLMEKFTFTTFVMMKSWLPLHILHGVLWLPYLSAQVRTWGIWFICNCTACKFYTVPSRIRDTMLDFEFCMKTLLMYHKPLSFWKLIRNLVLINS